MSASSSLLNCASTRDGDEVNHGTSTRLMNGMAATRPQPDGFAPLDFHVPRTTARTNTGSTGPPPYQHYSQSPPTVHKWSPNARKRVPWGVAAALFILLLCIVGCIVILKTSDGQPIESWPTAGAPVQPSVMLSIGAVLINMSIRFMFCEGITITWWKHAMRGSTVGELHRTWSYGNNIWDIFTAGRNFNMIALASLFVSIVAVDGPLLQKASKVSTVTYSDTNIITVNLNSNVSMNKHPTGYTTGRSSTVSLLSDELLPVVQQYNARSPIALNYTGCSGTCVTEIVGPGLDVRCEQSTRPLNLSMDIASTSPVMGFSFGFAGTFKPTTITLNNTFRKSDALDVLTVHNCTLLLATVRYPVQLSNYTVSLLPRNGSAINETLSLQTLNYESAGNGKFPSTLGGLALTAQRKFDSTASLYMNGAPYELDSTGEASIEYLATNTRSFSWLDPTEDMLSAVREIMFRYAVAISNATTAQTVPATTVTQRTIYSSDLDYLYYAIAFIAVAVISTSFNLIGWWELGRSFNLGPFEIAKAFDAPYLSNVAYLNTNEKSFKSISKRPIQYGELEEDPTDGKDEDRRSPNRNPIQADNMSEVTAFEMTEYNGATGEEGVRKRVGMGIPSAYR